MENTNTAEKENNEIKNYVDPRHLPTIPKLLFVDKAKGEAVFKFKSDKKAIIVFVGKGNDFSLREAFACAISDYAFGGRPNFEGAYAKVEAAMKKSDEQEKAKRAAAKAAEAKGGK